jgi:serine/threonine-protein kinase SRPK3
MLCSKCASACFYPKCYYHKSSIATQGFRLANFEARFPRVRSASRRVTSIGSSRSQFSTISLNSPPESRIEYHWIDGVEHLERYESGGYNPVMIDDLLHNRYRIVDKLGHGGYSTIWLARDETVKRYVAVKIGISNPSAPQREIDLLRALHCSWSESLASAGSNANICPAQPIVLNAFEIDGPNGTHACYTRTPAQGSLREASFSRLFPIQVTRALAARFTTAAAFVHSRGFVRGVSLRNHSYVNVISRLQDHYYLMPPL